MTTDYRVQLEAFDGPLDLLLFLIRRAEVDITDIPIAAITEQYVEHLRQIDHIDRDTEDMAALDVRRWCSHPAMLSQPGAN